MYWLLFQTWMNQNLLMMTINRMFNALCDEWKSMNEWIGINQQNDLEWIGKRATLHENRKRATTILHQFNIIIIHSWSINNHHSIFQYFFLHKKTHDGSPMSTMASNPRWKPKENNKSLQHLQICVMLTWTANKLPISMLAWAK